MTYYRKNMSLHDADQIKTLFLAEGDSEAFFIDALLRNNGCSEQEVYVFCFKGVSKLKAALRYLRSERNFGRVDAIGIMIDADDVPAGRLNMVCDILVNQGITGTRSDFANQVIVESNNRKIVVFVSPGNGQNGTIETLVRQEIATQPENDCIDLFVSCLSKIDIDLNEKSIVQQFISIRKPRLCGVGRAFQAGVLNVQADVYRQAADSLLSICDDS